MELLGKSMRNAFKVMKSHEKCTIFSIKADNTMRNTVFNFISHSVISMIYRLLLGTL